MYRFFSRMFLGCFSLALSLGWGTLSAYAEDDAATSYFEGLRHLKQKQWAQAEAVLKRTFTLLEQKKAPAGRSSSLLTLGQCDVLFLRAQAAEGQQKKQKMCRLLQKVSSRLSTIPKEWTTWSVNPVLPSRMRRAKEMFLGCKKIPTIIDVRVSPTIAIVEALLPPQKSTAQRVWVPVSGPLSLFRESLVVRARAEGYAPLEKTYTFRRWHPQRFLLKLKVLPKPTTRPAVRLAVIRRPPPPVKKGLPVGWIVGGVVVGAVLIAGGIVAGILLVNQANAEKVNVTIKGAPF